MDTTNSFLYTVLARVRGYLDDVDVDAKYTDDYIIRHLLTPTMVDVLSRLNLTTASPVILTFDISLSTSVYTYVLPPCIGEVLRLAVVDSDNNLLVDAYPRDRMDYRGKKWAIRGNPGAYELSLDEILLGTGTCQLWYASTGDVLPHYGTGTLADVSGTDTFTLAASPTLGVLDRRPNSYCGQVLRLLPASGAVEERIISTHVLSGGSWKVTVEKPFTETSDGSILYEIAPSGSQPLYEAISARTAMKMAAPRKNITEMQYNRIVTEYKSSLKTIGDNLTNLNARSGRAFEKATVDNPFATTWPWAQSRR